MVACVQERVSPEINILSVQHPIQFLQPGVTQLRQEKFSRAEGIRSIMQQDPDIIVAGELSGEPELVQEVIRAAETGYLVIATMHAHDAITPLFELAECGVKRSLIAANVIGIVNQHLLRKLCDHCRVRTEPSSEVVRKISSACSLPESVAFYESPGCEECNNTGYHGVFAVHETFSFSPDIRNAYIAGCTRDKLIRLAREQGLLSGLAEAVAKAAAGITSLDEVMNKLQE
jgi:type II secretory ATPase GspE/PulE/Tfp pilus assembly ATPase PilB-like protein